MKLTLLSLFVLALSAQQPSVFISVPISGSGLIVIASAISTAVILSYPALNSAACTVQVSERGTLNTSALVHDVDPVLFPGSDSNLRAGNVHIGLQCWAVVGERAARISTSGGRMSLAEVFLWWM